MDFEAIQRALDRLAETELGYNTIIFATDSMTVLSGLQSGQFPANWMRFRAVHPTVPVIWTYVPGHAGVRINERGS